MTMRVSDLPEFYVVIDTIVLPTKDKDIIEILQNRDEYYAIYARSVAFGPCKSPEDILKKIIMEISRHSDNFCEALIKMENILRELQGKSPRE